MTLGERIRQLRRYKGITGQQLGDIIGVKRNSISQLERDERSLNYFQLKTICDNLNIDSRYFFGEIIDINEADKLSKRYSNPSVTGEIDEVREVLSDLKKIYSSKSENDPVYERIRISGPLRTIVEKIMYFDGTVLKQIDALITGYLAQNKK